MQQPVDLDQLRELLLEAPESQTVRVLAIVLSTSLLAVVLLLVKRRTLRAEYTPIWVAVSVGITILSLQLDFFRVISRAIGAWTASSTIFFLGELFLIVLCLNYAVRLSRHDLQIKTLAQELTLLRARVEAQDTEE